MALLPSSQSSSAPQQRQRLRLRWVLVIPLVTQIFGMAALIGWLSVRNSREAVNELGEKLSRSLSEQVEEQVRQYFQTAQFLVQNSAVAVQSGNLDPNNFDRLQPYLWEQAALSQIVQTVYFVNPEDSFLQVERGADPTISVQTPATTPN